MKAIIRSLVEISLVLVFASQPGRAQTYPSVATAQAIQVSPIPTSEVKRIALKTLIGTLEKQYDIFFFYPSNLENKQITVYPRRAGETLDVFLNRTLHASQLGYEKLNTRHRAIKPVPEPSSQPTRLEPTGPAAIVHPSPNFRQPIQTKIATNQVDRTVSGTVRSEEGAIPGVNVLLKGSSTGTITDIQGNYQIEVPDEGGILVFSFIGFAAQEIKINSRSVINVVLLPDEQQLDEVIVTAVGIAREKKALGYAVAEIKGEVLAQKSEPDPVRSLSGRVPGVNINSGGGSVGGNTNITIRGSSSLTGNNQPLFIVDGVPFDNSTLGGGFSNGNVVTNRAFDLDPNNIETMTVLKGAAASALYGSRAANGVIVVTTKAGRTGSRRGTEVTFNSSYSLEEVASLPDYQYTFGPGGGQILVPGFFGSMGPRFSDLETISHPYDQPQLAEAFPEYQGVDIPFEPRRGQVEEFFRTGRVFENAINVTTGNETANLTAGLSYTQNDGFIPNSEVERINVNIGGNAVLENGLFISGTINYVNTEQLTPPVRPGILGSTSIMERVLLIPTHYAWMNLPYQNPLDGSSVYYRNGVDNPRWVTDNAYYESKVNRYYGKLQAGFDITDWLTVSYQAGFNAYTDRRTNFVSQGSANVDFANGILVNTTFYREELDGTLLITADRTVAPDLNLRAIIGHNINQRTTEATSVEATNQIIFGIDDITNFDTHRPLSSDFIQRRFHGIFGDFQFSYRDTYFLNVVARNDWSSTLPAENRSYFYPGASASVILTDALGITSKVLSYAKLRAGIAQVGNDAPPYRVETQFVTNPAFSGTQFPFTSPDGSLSNTVSNDPLLGNTGLRPELTTEYEVGADLQFFNNRIGLDVTYYNRVSTNNIVQIDVAPSSGVQNVTENLGEVKNYGVELGLSLTPIELQNGLRWDIFTAFTRNRNEVVSLQQGLDQIFIGGLAGGNLGIVHRPGLPFGQIFGSRYARDGQGTLLIRPDNGEPFEEPDLGIIGDPNPDFTLGLSNTITFRGLTLSALLEWRQGGDMYSETAQQLLGRGVTTELDQDIPREAGRIIPGLEGEQQEDGTVVAALDDNGNTIPNDYVIGHYALRRFADTAPFEGNVFDATTVRLREVSIGYQFSDNLLEKTPFGSARLSLTGRNLWYKAPNFPDALNFDPETSAFGANSNAQGLDFMGVPSTKRYGFNLSVTF